jgi:hypothetical protein
LRLYRLQLSVSFLLANHRYLMDLLLERLFLQHPWSQTWLPKLSHHLHPVHPPLHPHYILSPFHLSLTTKSHPSHSRESRHHPQRAVSTFPPPLHLPISHKARYLSPPNLRRWTVQCKLLKTFCLELMPVGQLQYLFPRLSYSRFRNCHPGDNHLG